MSKCLAQSNGGGDSEARAALLHPTQHFSPGAIHSPNRRKRTSMRSLLLATTAALMLTGSASAQLVRDSSSNAARVTGWTFAVLTIWHSSGRGRDSSGPNRVDVKREPFGVFTSSEDCEIARGKKIVDLDESNYRQPHKTPDQPILTTTITSSNQGGGPAGATTISTQHHSGPTAIMTVTKCSAENFSAVRQTAPKGNE